MPLSTDVVQAVSEYNVKRAKKVVLVVLGLVTAPNTTCLAVPEVVLLAPLAVPRKLPEVPLLTLQLPESVVELKVDEVVVKPAGALQAPEAVVQIWASNDWKVAVVAVVKSKVYVVEALAAELPKAKLRLVS
jgi:hypothetical protein